MVGYALDKTLPPTVNIPPPAGTPPNQIGWRPLLVNWFGSMFFVGLCSPLIVWLVVYYIRTHGKNAKKAANNKNGKSLSSRSLSTLKNQVKSEIQPLHGWTAAISENKLPKSKERLSKRDHFCRYLGWWTTSVADPRKSDEPDAEDKKGKDIPIPLTTEPRPWQMSPGRISLENLAERGQFLRALSSIPEVNTPKTEAPRQNDTNVRQLDGPSGSNGQPMDAEYVMSGGLGSDENGSDNNTVRKRTVRHPHAAHWAELSHQLSQSAQKKLLIFDEDLQPLSPNMKQENKHGQDLRQQELEGTYFAEGEYRRDSNVTLDSNLSTESPAIRSASSRPKLRRIVSSPALRIVYGQRSQRIGSQKSSGPSRQHIYKQAHQSSAPLILNHYRSASREVPTVEILKDKTNQLEDTNQSGKLAYGGCEIQNSSTPVENEVSVTTVRDSKALNVRRKRHRPKVPTGQPSPLKCRKRKHDRSLGDTSVSQASLSRSWSWDHTCRSSLDVPDAVKSSTRREKLENSTGVDKAYVHDSKNTIDKEDSKAEESLIDYERRNSLLDDAVHAAAALSVASASEAEEDDEQRRVSAFSNNGLCDGNKPEDEQQVFEFKIRVFSRSTGKKEDG